jgi:hypothetical protein
VRPSFNTRIASSVSLHPKDASASFFSQVRPPACAGPKHGRGVWSTCLWRCISQIPIDLPCPFIVPPIKDRVFVLISGIQAHRLPHLLRLGHFLALLAKSNILLPSHIGWISLEFRNSQPIDCFPLLQLSEMTSMCFTSLYVP